MTEIEKKVEKHKYKLADDLAPLISKEGLTDVTDWIEKNGGEVDGVGCTHNGVARSVSYILEATGDFQIEQLEDKSRFYVKRLPKRSLEQKHPTWFKFVFFLLGVGATYFGSTIKNNQSKNQPEKITVQVQDSRTDSLLDVVSKFQTELKTIQEKLKNDTSKTKHK